MGEVGARLEDLESTAGTMDTTASHATESGQQGTSLAERLHGEISDVTRVMSTEFTSMADGFREQVQRTMNELNVADWKGQRRQQAVDIADRFQVDVARVLNDAQTGVEDFGSRMSQAANEFVEAIRGGFQTAMDRANESFGALGTELRTTRDQLQEVDSSSGLTYG